MMPIVEIPESVAEIMEEYRSVFYREGGFEQVCRYITGLILSPNKTTMGIAQLQVRDKGEGANVRSMSRALWETLWDEEELMKLRRAELDKQYRGKGRTVISLDWTFSHHERGPKIWGNYWMHDHNQKRSCLMQTLMTAVISSPKRLDGIDYQVYHPDLRGAELEYLRQTQRERYGTKSEVQNRVLELLYHIKHTKQYKKRTEIAVEMVKRLEEEGKFAQSDYAFDNGLLCIELARLIEGYGKHWVSELEKSRNILFDGKWQRIDLVDDFLRKTRPQSFRRKEIKRLNGEKKTVWVFSKVVRLRKFGRKRIAIVHKKENLEDEATYLITDAFHWEGVRMIETYQYRWSSDVFHEQVKQVAGLESSQHRNEEAVKRHFCLSYLAHSVVMNQTVEASFERFAWAKEKETFGRRLFAILRQSFRVLLEKIKSLFGQGLDCNEILEVLMPA